MPDKSETVSARLNYPFTTYRQELDAKHANLEIQMDGASETATLLLSGRRKEYNSKTRKYEYTETEHVAEIKVPNQLIQDMLNDYFRSSRRQEELRIAITQGKLRDMIRGKWKPRTVMREVKNDP